MKGSSSKYNCYKWISHPSSKVKSMKKIISEDDVKGLPKFMIEEGKISGECQIRKQTKMSQHHTHVYELPLMDFMRLMRKVIIEGKADGQAGGPPNIEQPTMVEIRRYTRLMIMT